MGSNIFISLKKTLEVKQENFAILLFSSILDSFDYA